MVLFELYFSYCLYENIPPDLASNQKIYICACVYLEPHAAYKLTKRFSRRTSTTSTAALGRCDGKNTTIRALQTVLTPIGRPVLPNTMHRLNMDGWPNPGCAKVTYSFFNVVASWSPGKLVVSRTQELLVWVGLLDSTRAPPRRKR